MVNCVKRCKEFHMERWGGSQSRNGSTCEGKIKTEKADNSLEKSGSGRKQRNGAVSWQRAKRTTKAAKVDLGI